MAVAAAGPSLFDFSQGFFLLISSEREENKRTALKLKVGGADSRPRLFSLANNI